ncbi:MAG: HRDC domain-containing protein [Anaerolineae bacterium]|nr:HRDC domain-containing protein [Anaerolineae bacterium]
MSNLPKPILITTSDQLQDLVEKLTAQATISVDTESNSLYVYQEQVCLIQFSIPDGDFLVDPLALGDLSSLGPIFNNPAIEKIFHAAEYDLLCLKRDFGFEFQNLFDTMLAARISGRKKVGLGNLLEAEFGIQLEKRFQRADWGKRPLTDEMLAYARLDTYYLPKLRAKLRTELETKQRLALAQEDFQRVCAVNGKAPGPVGTDIWRINGARDLTSKQAAVLQELVIYRDLKAKKYNLPVFKVIGDKTLIGVAVNEPVNFNGLKTIPGMTPKQIDRHGKALLTAVRNGGEGAPVQRPRKPRLEDDYVERVEALREWRKQTARQFDVESDVVMPRDLLYEIAEKNPANGEELAQILETVPWRLERYGQGIQEVLANM